MTTGTASDVRTRARTAYVVNAVVAWTGVALTVLFSALGWYRALPTEPGLYGNTPDGLAGAVARVGDTLSYFTIWSNIVVAVSMTLVALQPRAGTTVRRVLRLAGLLMITVTGIVYQVLLAPDAVIVGWARLTDPILHVITPLVTLVVWLVFGPRGQITARIVPLVLTLPLLWIAWMLARGAVIDAYPYPFVNVAELGYASVSLTLSFILAFSLALTALLWGVDSLLARRGSTSTAR